MFVYALGVLTGAFVMWCWMDCECDNRYEDDEEDM